MNTKNAQCHRFRAFPFEPYDIQLHFMTALYDALEKGGVAILESPTGTGKTLSLICSVLQWLVDQKSKAHLPVQEETAHQNNENDEDDEPDWMRDFDVQKQLKEAFTNQKKRVKRYRGKNPSKASKNFLGNPEILDDLEKVASSRQKTQKACEDDLEYLIDDYESEDDQGNAKKTKRRATLTDSDTDNDNEGDDLDSETVEEEPLKVFYCSRTHSQLSQFVKELRRTPFARSLKVACLGSRKTFCVNPDVSKLNNRDRINDRCLELQKNKTCKKSKKIGGEGVLKKTASACPMLRKKKIKQFKRISQQDALDVEDLVSLGRSIGACPYYGSRDLVPSAHIVILPYQSLLLKSARESLGISLKDSVIVIDEAHNLVDTLQDMHNSQISTSQLQLVSCHLSGYMAKFRNQLGSGSRRYIQMLMVLVQAFLQCFLANRQDEDTKMSEEKEAKDVVLTINEFLFWLEIDNINLIKLQCFIRESNIIHKVNGYGEKYLSELNDGKPRNAVDLNLGSPSETVSAFRALSDFLNALTCEQSVGRVVISKKPSISSDEPKVGYLKFLMLNAESIFSEILDQAHSVVLAGGTLKPIEEIKDQLFPFLPADKLHLFSCGHIVPPENILPIAVTHGPTGKIFSFTYESRSSPTMINANKFGSCGLARLTGLIEHGESSESDESMTLRFVLIEELGRLLCNVASVIPEGIVVFFSSFEYENLVYRTWKESGILRTLEQKKRIFQEPRSTADVESTLQEYKAAVMPSTKITGESRAGQGAILLAVVGGKISEGINFSDGMGRCVVMVGLPYPNHSNPELVERIKHIDKLGASLGENASSYQLGDEGYVQPRSNILRLCKSRGREYYENLCMKAVNQSVGRAIRHIGDYAAILLVDSRYASTQDNNTFNTSLSKPSSKLPDWIKERLVAKGNFGAVQKMLSEFFKYQQKKAVQNP